MSCRRDVKYEDQGDSLLARRAQIDRGSMTKDVISTLGGRTHGRNKESTLSCEQPNFRLSVSAEKTKSRQGGITFAREPGAFCFPRELNEFTREFTPRSAGFNLHRRERDRQTNHFLSRSFHIFYRPIILARSPSAASRAHGLAMYKWYFTTSIHRR